MGFNKINVNNESTTIITNDFGLSETLSISQKTLTNELSSGFSYDISPVYNSHLEATDIPGKYKLKSTAKQNFASFLLNQKLQTLEHNLILEFDTDLPNDTFLYMWVGRSTPYNWYWLDEEIGINLVSCFSRATHYTTTINILKKDKEYRSDTVCIWMALTAVEQDNPEKYPLEGYVSNIKVYDAVDGEKTTLKDIVNNVLKPLIPQVQQNTEILSEIYPLNVYDKDVHSSFSKVILADSSAFTGYNAETGNVMGVRHAAGNSWNSMHRSIIPDFSIPLTIEFDVIDVSPYGTVWISPDTSYIDKVSLSIGSYTNGHNKITIDPQYYAAHVSEQYTQFNFWPNPSPNPQLEENQQVIFQNIEVYQTDFCENISGGTAKELFRSVDTQITVLKNNIPEQKENYIISPSGKKYIISATDNGQVSLIPLVPTKMAFFGNSLLSAFGYGMSASDSRHDYFYLISEYVKTLNPNATASRKSGVQSAFETGQTEQEVRGGITTMLNALTGDETLVAVQLTDNTRDNQQSYIYDVYHDLFVGIRTKCPSARVVFHGAWYASTWKLDAVKRACEETGVLFITYDGIKGGEANSYMGAVYETPDGSVQSFSYGDVNSVTENGTDSDGRKLLNVTFTVTSQTYNTTYPVDTYSYSGTTLTGTSKYKFITSAGVASHPGNEGFRRIANLFLYKTGLSDTEETYPA